MQAPPGKKRKADGIQALLVKEIRQTECSLKNRFVCLKSWHENGTMILSDHGAADFEKPAFPVRCPPDVGRGTDSEEAA